MMTTLRSQMKTILWILVIAFLATIVFSWGMGGFKERVQPGVIGKIGKHDLLAETFENYVQRKVQTAQRTDSTTVDDEKQKQIREDAWDEQIEKLLKDKEAEAEGLTVTDKEVAFIIENYPPNEIRQVKNFQRDGQFAPDLYMAFLRTPQAAEYLSSMEGSVRDYLLEQKMQFYVQQATDISELAVKDEWNRSSAKAKFAFVAFPIDKMDVDSNSITDDMMRKYYNLFPDRYKQYGQRKFVYVKFKLDPSADDSADVLKNAEELIDELKKGGDFAELAKEHSEDPGSGAKGGDLGWITHGQMAKQFEDAAFSAPVGEIVGPVVSRFGLHIIRVDEKKTEDGKEQALTKHILLKYKASQDTREAVRSYADALAQDAKQVGFDKAADQSNLKVDTTKQFSEAGYIAGLGRMRMAAQFSFHNPVGTVSDVFAAPDGYVVFKIIEATDESNKSFDEAKDQVKKAVLRLLKQQKAWEAAASFRGKVTGAADFVGAAAGMGVPVFQSADSAKVDDKLPEGLRADKDFAQAVFRLAPGETSDVIEGRQGCYVATMIYKATPPDGQFEANHFAIYADLLNKDQDATAKNWVRELRIANKIDDLRYKYYRDF